MRQCQFTFWRALVHVEFLVSRTLDFDHPQRRCQVNRRSWKMRYPARHAPACQLQAPSLSATDHCPCALAVLSFPAELAAGRRASGRARYRRFVQNLSPLGQEVRATICPAPEAEATEPKRYRASGRGCHQHRWKEALLWRAVDQDGYVLDEIVQSQRNTTAAKRLLTRLLQKQGMRPKRIITDKLRSYGAARQQVMSKVEHRSHKGLNNRAENSHVPLRKRERMMQRFRSVGALQRFVSIFSAIRNLFVPPSAKRSSLQIHLHRFQAMEQWQVVTRAA
jgi:putative transposase